MKKFLLFVGGMISCVMAYGQTAESVIEKFKTANGVEYIHMNGDEFSGSLNADEFSKSTKNILSNSFITGFVSQMKGIKSAEMLLIAQNDVLAQVSNELQALGSRGYAKSSTVSNDNLCYIKQDGKNIAEIVFLKNKTKDDKQAMLLVLKK